MHAEIECNWNAFFVCVYLCQNTWWWCKPTHAPATEGSGSPYTLERGITAGAYAVGHRRIMQQNRKPTQSAAQWIYATCERVQRHGTFLFGRDATCDLHLVHLVGSFSLEKRVELKKQIERKKSAQWGSNDSLCHEIHARVNKPYERVKNCQRLVKQITKVSFDRLALAWNYEV